MTSLRRISALADALAHSSVCESRLCEGGISPLDPELDTVVQLLPWALAPSAEAVKHGGDAIEQFVTSFDLAAVHVAPGDRHAQSGARFAIGASRR